ncbi:hypothetical protein TCE0_034r11285 [Talaromyces pinophilus]|uniref:Uncharacterized protein n=1 Tax=Talaromyces pinophilus TaxID=128442 RepID=A0A6V8HE43_TALPI|nr:hypothetical protein TCE0_034r11285 [Talaromyces pinophilus]
MHLPTTLFLLSTAITLPYQTLALPIAETEQHNPVIERRRATYSVVNHILYTNDYHPANNSFNNSTRLINNDELLFICIRCNFHFLHIQRVDTSHIAILILHTYNDDTMVIIILAVMGPIHGAPTFEAHGADHFWVSELEVQKDRRREEYRYDAVLVLVAMVEVVDVVTEAAAGEGEAEPVTEDIVEDGKAEVVVTEEEVVDEDEVDELVVVTELPIVVKIEMEPARENVPFPV